MFSLKEMPMTPTKYCSGITKNGNPCTLRTKHKYCNNHAPKKGSEHCECPICYDEMQCKVELKCGHSFCLPCLQNWEWESCPICRAKTNQVYRDVKNKISLIRKILSEFPDMKGKEKQIENAHIVMKTALTIHSFLFRHTFLQHFEEKSTELQKSGMNTDRYRRALESYHSRIQIRD